MPTLSVELHPQTPESYKIAKIVNVLRSGAVMLYPTDTGFALGCCLSQKNAIARIRQIRRLPENKHLTFLCDSLSHIAEFAKVSNHAYRVIKRLIPGPYTFILPATKAVPHYAVDPKRKTTGIRVPENPIALALLKELGNPLISITARVATDDDEEIETPEELIEKFASLVDVVIASEVYHFEGESTVIDMTDDAFSIIRRGARVQTVLREVPELQD
ncbi:MAG: L-threonylcarbamoyladenylate synthase [Candidatus Kapabacteria bacterium]|jgi:tRNA threonylcarbamoyl adenosine modification protein (Sua5/YciO/YrdC/YwlC family)|nr:L-threonylcarbamoyladenylate synthase [Candidatus Kapabacteria bacterium]